MGDRVWVWRKHVAEACGECVGKCGECGWCPKQTVRAGSSSGVPSVIALRWAIEECGPEQILLSKGSVLLGVSRMR